MSVANDSQGVAAGRGADPGDDPICEKVGVVDGGAGARARDSDTPKARLAAALRDNLKKRKAQARLRAGTRPAAEEP
ncbi:MAG: hypothetical protein IPK66_14910 [Rhodospirillales bacterium]|nr:hypothetical protein [Rhodospirillales bacterium]